jgi:hypothetical protein
MDDRQSRIQSFYQTISRPVVLEWVFDQLEYTDNYDQLLASFPNGSPDTLPQGQGLYRLFYNRINEGSTILLQHPFNRTFDLIVWFDQKMNQFEDINLRLLWTYYKIDALELFIEEHQRLPHDFHDIDNIYLILYHLLGIGHYHMRVGTNQHVYLRHQLFIKKYTLPVGNYSIESDVRIVNLLARPDSGASSDDEGADL